MTFERRAAESKILPDWAQGACGWQAVWADNEENARSTLARNLAAVDLRLLEVDHAKPITSREVEDYDEWLSENLRKVEPGRQAVRGTIHCYAADGEV